MNQFENFDQLLIEAIDEGLASLGEAGKASIYINLETRFNIRKQQIPARLNDFSNALVRIFGQGSRHLEILLIKKVHSKLEVKLKLQINERSLSKWTVPEMTLTEYAHLSRQSFESTQDKK